MTNNKITYNWLETKTWQTKGTRFTAHERLITKHRWSTFSLAMISLYLIAISISDLIGLWEIYNSYSDYKSAAILFLSVFILIITLIEGSKNYLMQAEKMHQCALEIQAIYQIVQLNKGTEKDTYKSKKDLLEKYNGVLQKYPNHEERSYKIFKANNYQDFVFAGISCTLIKLPIAKVLLVWYWILDFWMYILFIFAPPVITFLLYGPQIF